MVQSNETEARNTTSQTVSVRMTGEILQTIEQAAERKQLSVGQYLREAGYAAASRRRRPRRRGQGRLRRARPQAASIDVDGVAAAVAAKLGNMLARWMPDQDDGYRRWNDNAVLVLIFAMMVGAGAIGGLVAGLAGKLTLPVWMLP